MKKIKFYYDIRSPYSYFAWHRRHLLSEVGAQLEYVPVSIDVLLNLQAEREPWADYVDPLAPPKRSHLLADIRRLVDYWNIPMGGPFTFKPQSTRAMCVATELHSQDLDQEDFIDSAINLLWQKAKDLSDNTVLNPLIEKSLLDGFSKNIEQQAHRKLTERTIAAYSQGVYGVPTFQHEDQIYFGADRMELLASSVS